MVRACPLLVLMAALALGGCGRPRGESTTGADPTAAPPQTALAAIPLGAPPGQARSPASAVNNPYEGDASAIAQGKALFSAMNCVYCHGAGASGLMGPALNGTGWRFGGTPAQLYNSIHDGRPKGMPAWGDRLPADQIWKLVAYLESLGGAQAPATAPMQTLGGAAVSATGDQAAGQSQSDTSEAARRASNQRAGV
jgi:cytochrome c oxidase cbb3-type subunit 3